MITDDGELVFKTLKPGKCPRCGIDNPIDAKYCSTCGLIINKDAAKVFDEKRGGMGLEFMDIMQREPRMLEILKNFTKEAEAAQKIGGAGGKP
ncbi:Uncharacterised protein [uncultured archaeon]|nr:Uncharacterised protein [uncultured archaeon]